MAKGAKKNRYASLIEKVFHDRYKPGATEIPFARTDLEDAASALGIQLPKNIGDILYSIRYRTSLPESVLVTQPKNREWLIEGTGVARYAFRLVKIQRIVPNPSLIRTKIPDATPEIISAYALSDEQALLAKIRYNRLVDIFVGMAAYSLQNHLRTTVQGIGQIEIDEIYVGVDKHGCQYIIPLQAKGGADQLSVVQTRQDLECCQEKFPALVCRALSAQFIASDLIAMFELDVKNDEVRIIEERHYHLVPSSDIEVSELKKYARRSTSR